MKKLDFSKKIVISLLFTYLLFIVICIVYQFVARDSMSEALIVSVSGFCTGEASILGYLKAKERKTKKGEDGEC